MRECKECGKSFQPNKFTPYQQFCSRQCKQRAYDHRRSERRLKKYNEERMELLRFLGGKCAACGIEDFFVLTIDHIYSDRKKGQKNGHNFVAKMLANPQARARLQVLCWNHNAMKQVYPEEFQRRFPNIAGCGSQVSCQPHNWLVGHERVKNPPLVYGAGESPCRLIPRLQPHRPMGELAIGRSNRPPAIISWS